MANTPYDDVLRTLLNDCSSLILPVLNAVFWESYTGEEAVVTSQNESFLNQQDGNPYGDIPAFSRTVPAVQQIYSR